MRLPAARRLTGQGARLRSEKFGVRIPSGRPNLAVVADRQMHLTVYQDQAGSIPVHRAKVLRGVVGKRFKPPDFQSGDRRFESGLPCHRREAHQDEHAILNREVAGSIPAAPARVFARSPNWQGSALLMRHNVGSSPTLAANFFGRIV